jgi:hypothetical protein
VAVPVLEWTASPVVVDIDSAVEQDRRSKLMRKAGSSKNGPRFLGENHCGFHVHDYSPHLFFDPDGGLQDLIQHTLESGSFTRHGVIRSRSS